MEPWETMFGGVQKIVRESKTWGEGLTQTISFARRHSQFFDDADYWNRVDEATQWPLAKLQRWGEEGLSRFKSDEWSILFLDLGDAPETFALLQYDWENLIDEDKFRKIVFSQNVVDDEDFANCLVEDRADVEVVLFAHKPLELAYHNVRNLGHEILNWHTYLNSFDYAGDNAYLLWLAMGTLALIEPLRDAQKCRAFLGDCPRVYLLAGYEEIFFYAGTVTPNGLEFETVAP